MPALFSGTGGGRADRPSVPFGRETDFSFVPMVCIFAPVCSSFGFPMSSSPGVSPPRRPHDGLVTAIEPIPPKAVALPMANGFGFRFRLPGGVGVCSVVWVQHARQ